MTETEIKLYIQTHYPKENESCDWKEFSNLKHVVKGHASEDIASYCSAFSNMEGGYLVMGVKDGSLDITGIQDLAGYTPETLKAKPSSPQSAVRVLLSVRIVNGLCSAILLRIVSRRSFKDLYPL